MPLGRGRRFELSAFLGGGQAAASQRRAHRGGQAAPPSAEKSMRRAGRPGGASSPRVTGSEGRAGPWSRCPQMAAAAHGALSPPVTPAKTYRHAAVAHCGPPPPLVTGSAAARDVGTTGFSFHPKVIKESQCFLALTPPPAPWLKGQRSPRGQDAPLPGAHAAGGARPGPSPTEPARAPANRPEPHRTGPSSASARQRREAQRNDLTPTLNSGF